MKAFLYRIRGGVQGVGYRFFVRERAQRLGLSGSVRNLPDGSVEAQAAGDANALAAFERELREGHPYARVEAVEAAPRDPAGIRPGFRIES